jgi:hypothetical protein
VTIVTAIVDGYPYSRSIGDGAGENIIDVTRKCAVSSFQYIHALRKNLAITERHRRAIRFIVRSLAYGFVLGIVARAAWDYGVIGYIALALRDLGIVIWIMLRDSSAACWDFLKFVFR